MFKKILVAFDGSEHARKAAAIAGEFANMMEADIWVVVAYDPLPSYLGKPNIQAAIDSRLDEAEAHMKDAIQDIGEISGSIIKEILEGPASEAILNVAEVREIELIIMGTRGLGSLKGLLIGSTGQKVLSHALCPVLLAK
ncbi:MAG: universal stress protein [Anaerolineales bacterium]